MPIVRVDITGPRTAEYRSAVLRGVRVGVVNELGAPDERVTVRLTEGLAECMDAPSCRTDRFTVVDIMLYAGRTPETKAACAAAIRGNLEVDPQIPSSEVVVAFHDMDPIDLDV